MRIKEMRRRSFWVLMFAGFLLAGSATAYAETDMIEEESLTWEELLKKAKANSMKSAKPAKSEAPSATRPEIKIEKAPKSKPAAPAAASAPEPQKTRRVNVEWTNALKSAGFVHLRPNNVLETYYENGALQSQRTFDRGEIRSMKWYSKEGVLMFDGTFQEGKLVHRYRYDAFTGKLESEWGTRPPAKS